MMEAGVESDNLGMLSNFSPRTLLFLWQFCQLEDGPLSLSDGGLGDSLKTSAAQEQSVSRCRKLEASVDCRLPPRLDTRSV